MATFSEWFAKTREQKGQTQGQAAEALQLSGPTISRWEAGTAPRSTHLLRIMKWSGIKADKLLRILAA